MSLRARVAAGEVLLGTFLNLGSSLTAEICGLAGFDWVLIDLEHGSGSDADLLHQLQALAATPAAAVVRVESNARPRFSRALDLGADGIMVPRVDSADDARAAVASLRYPPAGVRGVATLNRAGGFGARGAELIAGANDTVVGVIQIESTAAVDAAADIAAVDGADVLFVGPGDLTADMGMFGCTDDAGFRDAVAHVAAAAGAAGKAAGILVPTAEAAEDYLGLGYTFVAIGADSAMLSGAARTSVGRARALAGAAASSAGPDR